MSFLKKGNDFFINEKYDSARKCYDKALNLNPGLSEFINLNYFLCEKRIGFDGSIFNDYSVKFKNSVDVVIPVYNAVEDVKNCLISIIENKDDFLGKVIIVNDASDKETTDYLRDFCCERESFYLIEHDVNYGYTKTVNDGLKVSTAEFVVTLNSDTIVTNGWIEGLLACFIYDENVGVAGPLSNAASWQSVPELWDEKGEFLVNEIPSGLSIEDFARLIKKTITPTYPSLPFINGFCFMMRRLLLEKIGYLDEINFPEGYGEENDFCIRVIDSGLKLVVADNVFVYHSKSKSFGHDRRKYLSKKGSDNLRIKYGSEKYKNLIGLIKNTKSLDLIRFNIKNSINQYNYFYNKSFIGNLNIIFYLPVKGGGGGTHSVIQEAVAMRSLGINVKVGLNPEDYKKFYNSYPNIIYRDEIFLQFDELDPKLENVDILVATVFKSVPVVNRVCNKFSHIMPAYYIQDYEPFFFEDKQEEKYQAEKSYDLMRNAFCFAKTEWIINTVREKHGVSVSKVLPSIDHQVYFPAFKNNKKVKICAMIRPKTPYRGSKRTMELFSLLSKAYQDVIEFNLFGCSDTDDFWEKNPYKFKFINHGVLSREGVANILRSNDIFIDLSDYQAFGRTALEAMACGCVAVITKYGGVHEYARDGVNSFLVDSFNIKEVYEKVENLISSKDVLHEMRLSGLETASKYNPHQSAISELTLFVKALQSHRLHFPKINKKNLVLYPSRRGDGKPAGSGYVRLVLPYTSNNTVNKYKVNICDALPDPKGFEKCILQRDVEPYSIEELKIWVKKIKDIGKSYIYEIDDDFFDSEGLVSRGYKKNPFDLLEKVKFLASNAELVTVSTEPLKKILSPYNSSVQVVKNMLDANLWKLHEKRNHTGLEYGREEGVVKIGYIGTDSHYDDLKLIAPAIQKLEERYGDKILVEVIGVFQNKGPLFGKRVPLPQSTDYPSFVKWLLKRVHWDIGLIPLVDDRFNKSKSNLKFLEYAALDMAIVVSESITYKNIANNENSLIVRGSVDNWFDSISFLINDKEKRLSIANKSREEIINNWTLDNFFIDF